APPRRRWRRPRDPRHCGAQRVEAARKRADDPAIHPFREKFLRRMMDPRVKPAGDVVGLRSIPFVIAGHSASKTRVNALMTRQTIRFAESFYEERWTPVSSPLAAWGAWGQARS